MDAIQPSVIINKAQQVARLLLERIVRDDMSSGDTFGTEAELLEQYDVSRPTLRESLRILESQGVLSLRPGPRGGIIVGRPSIEMLSHTLSVYLRLNRVPLVEILRARIAIEPALVRDAAVHGTDEQFARMESSIERLEAATDDDNALIYRENREFHNIIAEASANPVLAVFWETICSMASGEGERNITFSERNRRAIAKAHREILDACKSRDPDAAQVQMAEHLGELDVLLRHKYKDELKGQMQIKANPGQGTRRAS